MDSRSKILMGAALGGMLMAASCGGSETADTPLQTDLGECHGINACKGQSACHTKETSCAGQNSCKGKGWLQMSKEECKEKDGDWKELSMEM
ncbi:MAG: hypothetical protein RH862_08750 [Leptospiraceae bacterium]